MVFDHLTQHAIPAQETLQEFHIRRDAITGVAVAKTVPTSADTVCMLGGTAARICTNISAHADALFDSLERQLLSNHF